MPVMLVANKVDLRADPEPSKTYITHDDGQRVARVRYSTCGTGEVQHW